MITANSIRAIKMAQRDTGLGDAEYRAMLGERFHVASCKQLEPDQVKACIEALKAAGKREGWQPGQLSVLARYRRALGWTVPRMRVEIRQVTGEWTELSPRLGQAHFDRVMQVVEHCLEAQLVAAGRDWPAGMQPRYWRTRNAGCNRRLVRKLEELWTELCRWLPEGSRTDEYLCGIVAQATGFACRSRYGLQVYQVLPTIEALKDRLAYTSENRAGEVMPLA